MVNIGFLVFPQFNILDLSGPAAVFEAVVTVVGTPTYRCILLSETGGAVTSSSGITVDTELLGQTALDTLIVVGGRNVEQFVCSKKLMDFLQLAPLITRRQASVCTGAFILGAAGLLTDKRVTTHWSLAGQLKVMYPRIHLQEDKIFIRDGQLWTSGGVTAGIDLALSLLEDDMGNDVARAVARMLVVYYRRAGDQRQFSALLELSPSTDRIANVLTYMRENLQKPVDLPHLAKVAHLSVRQFTRVFLTETGTTPGKALVQMRSEVAKQLLENGRLPLVRVANEAGFTDERAMRRVMMKIYGQSPYAIRQQAQMVHHLGAL